MAGNTPAASKPSESVTIPHPLFDGDVVDGGNYRDAIDNCAATLWLLADLFGDNETINSLDSPRARRGMFLQLMGVASALESVNEFLGLEADRKSNLDETEREARRLMLRAQEDRIAEEPEVIRKRAIIAGAMADVIQRTLNESKPKKQATDS